MLAGLIQLSHGTFLSITYFIVIPIIPDKKQHTIVTDIKIPVLLFSFVLSKVASATPRDSPARDPASARRIVSGSLEP